MFTPSTVTCPPPAVSSAVLPLSDASALLSPPFSFPLQPLTAREMHKISIIIPAAPRRTAGAAEARLLLCLP